VVAFGAAERGAGLAKRDVGGEGGLLGPTMQRYVVGKL